MKKLIYTAILGLSLMCGSCTDFLEDQLPQGTISDEQLKNPAYIDNLVISAYAVWITAEDINSSFSMWNYDVRSDDAYKGGNGTEDGDVFHSLDISQRYHDYGMEHQRYVAASLQLYLTCQYSFATVGTSG